MYENFDNNLLSEKPKTVLENEEDGLLVTTGDKEIDLQEAADRFRRYDPDFEFTVMPFKAEIIKADPKTGVVEQWEKRQGFSLWKRARAEKKSN